MEDSLKYGIPSGIFAFLTLWCTVSIEPELISVWRWILVATVVNLIVQWQLRKRNKAYYPFGMAFLSGFNVTFIMTITEVVLMYFLDTAVIGEVPQDVNATKWVFYNMFTEAMGLMVVALLMSALTAFLFKRSLKPK